MTPYQEDLRRKIVEYAQKGGRKSEVAKIFGVGEKTVYRYLALWKEGDLKPKKMVGKWKKIDPELLRQDVEENSEATLEERAKKFGTCHQAIWKALRKIGMTLKKK